MNRGGFLILIVIVGLALRCYNLNFPSLGYHNMKENEYLSMAQLMLKTQDFLNKRVYFQNALQDNPVVKDDLQPPLFPYQIMLSWNLWGENLWAPRLFNVLFGVLGIIVIYLVSNLLFNNQNLSLLSASLLAVMPLGVFFSRNIQPESPAFFFMLLGNFFYLKFIRSEKKYNLLLGGIALCLAWFYKFNFLIGVLPVLFCMPLRSLFRERKSAFNFILLFALPYLSILAFMLWVKAAGRGGFHFSPNSLLQPLGIAYWKNQGEAILWYIKGENFAFLYVLLACCGFFLALFKREGLLGRYLVGGVFSMLIYVMLFHDEISQNSYAQMPFLAMVCISCVYAASFIAQEIARFAKKEFPLYLVFLILPLATPDIYRSLQRMYGTCFLGQDVAGESLKEFTQDNERVFLLTHSQGYAIARYAQRFMGWPSTLEEFKEKEEKFKIRFVCVYPGEYLMALSSSMPSLFEYIRDNYGVKEIGLVEETQRVSYFILERGKGKNVKEFMGSFSGGARPRAIYKIAGRYVFLYTMRP